LVRLETRLIWSFSNLLRILEGRITNVPTRCIVRDSDKQFRIRVSGYLGGLGVSQIIGTKEYLEIVFIGGDYSLRLGYPQKLEELFEVVKKKLLLETELGIKDINSIGYFINEYTN
jgi:hypothetical protein